MTNHDAFTRVSDNQSLIGASAGLAISTSSINLVSSGITARMVGRDVGVGGRPVFRVHITQAFDAGAGNLTISVAFATNEALTVGSVVPALVVTNALLVAGAEFDVPIPTPTSTLIGGAPLQYIGLLYAAAGGAIDAGAVSAWITMGDTPGTARQYLGNYTGP